MTSNEKTLVLKEKEAGLWYWYVSDQSGNILEESPFGFTDPDRCQQHARTRGY
jgi:hypothetical protein